METAWEGQRNNFELEKLLKAYEVPSCGLLDFKDFTHNFRSYK